MINSLQNILTSYNIDIFGIGSIPKKEDWGDCYGASRVPKNSKSLIICIFPYNIGATVRNISRYAVALDYHTIIGNILQNACDDLKKKFGGSFVPFVDVSPFLEKPSAAQAGLGVLGWNTLLITPQYGSYVFIGEIATDIAFPAEKQKVQPCLQCGKCYKACPTGALSDQGLNREKCISALTQKKGELTTEEIRRIQSGGSAWGCDICQDCCPMNRHAALSPLDVFYQEALPIIGDPLPADFKKRAYGYKGRKVLERNITIINKDTPE